MKSGGLDTLVAATLFLFVVNLPAIMNEAGARNLPFYGELIIFFLFVSIALGVYRYLSGFRLKDVRWQVAVLTVLSSTAVPLVTTMFTPSGFTLPEVARWLMSALPGITMLSVVFASMDKENAA